MAERAASARAKACGARSRSWCTKATTHWAVLPELRRFTGVEVVEHVRFVRDGQIVTSAGVSAGIDMALWLFGQLRTPQEARKVQRIIQYDPAPPYQALT